MENMNKKQISRIQDDFLNKFKKIIEEKRATATKDRVARGTGFSNESLDCLEEIFKEYLENNSSFIYKKDANVFFDKLVTQIKMRTKLTGCQNRVNVANEIINHYDYKSIKQIVINRFKKVFSIVTTILGLM
jgi:hypothetical protein